jgi:hypothetical protein
MCALAPAILLPLGHGHLSFPHWLGLFISWALEVEQTQRSWGQLELMAGLAPDVLPSKFFVLGGQPLSLPSCSSCIHLSFFPCLFS